MPLVDVMLVLLIIFMVAAPMLQRGVEVNLPQGRRSRPIADDRVFITRAAVLPHGSPRVLRRGSGSHRGARRARAPDDAAAGSEGSVPPGDGAVTYQELVDVMDRLKEGGVEKVGLVTRLPETPLRDRIAGADRRGSSGTDGGAGGPRARWRASRPPASRPFGGYHPADARRLAVLAYHAQIEGPVMTISLGGTPLAARRGMNALGGRAIQDVRTRAGGGTARARSPAGSPHAGNDDARSRGQDEGGTEERRTVKSAPDEAKGRTPTRGAETREGSAIVETGATGAGQGLTTFGGGGGTGGYLDTKDFCCPEYLVMMKNLIQRNWNGRRASAAPC